MSTTYGATGLGQTASTGRVYSFFKRYWVRFWNGANARGYEPPCAT